MRRFITLPVLLLAAAIAAQDRVPVDKSELLAKLDACGIKFKELGSYTMHSTLQAYTNATDPTPTEEATSTVWYSGKSMKAEHLGVISYQNERVCVTIDPEEQMVVLGEPGNSLGDLSATYREEVFGHAASIDRAEVAGLVHYRARFAKGSDFVLIEYAFDKAGWLRRVETHWGVPVALAPDVHMSATVLPKVVIVMDAPVRIAPGSVKTTPDEAVAFEGRTAVLRKPYAHYTLIDNRAQP